MNKHELYELGDWHIEPEPEEDRGSIDRGIEWPHPADIDYKEADLK